MFAKVKISGVLETITGLHIGGCGMSDKSVWKCEKRSGKD